MMASAYWSTPDLVDSVSLSFCTITVSTPHRSPCTPQQARARQPTPCSSSHPQPVTHNTSPTSFPSSRGRRGSHAAPNSSTADPGAG